LIGICVVGLVTTPDISILAETFDVYINGSLIECINPRDTLSVGTFIFSRSMDYSFNFTEIDEDKWYAGLVDLIPASEQFPTIKSSYNHNRN